MKFPHAKMSGESSHSVGVHEISCADLNDSLSEVRIIDVRRPDEWSGELGHIEGATLSTLETTFGADISAWPRDEVYVFVCKSGVRSTSAAHYAHNLGFKEAYNLEGGMMAWNGHGLPTVK